MNPRFLLRLSLPAVTANRRRPRLCAAATMPGRRLRPRFRTGAAPPKSVALAIVSASLFALAGCQIDPDSRTDARSAASVPYLSVEEFAAILDARSGDVLVEFCVPSGCFRCDEMRDTIDRLASDRREGLTVHRVNLKEQPALAWEFDVTVCPSYVAFRDGVEVYRAAYPTSAGLIASGIEESLGESSAEPHSLAAQ